MTPIIQRLSKSDGTFAFHDHGNGAPLLLIHGVGMQSAAWTPQIETLSKTHRIIAVDMPGHGRSAPLPKGSHLPDFVAWICDVVHTLDLGAVNVAGHSMGALIAAGLAITHPDLTLRVALLNGVYRRGATASAAVITRATEIRAGKIDIEAPLKRWFGETPTDLMARNQVAAWLKAVDPSGYATAYTAFAHGDSTYASQYPEISCPFLAITGDGDPNSTSTMSRTMAAQVQHGDAIILDGHRHMVNLTAADVVSAHLSDWLKLPTLRKELQ